MISIDSVAITDPSTFAVSILEGSRSWRNANFLFKKDVIATKRKLELSWAVLTNAQLSTLLGQVSGNFFTVEYPDPQTGAARSGTFYCGPKTAGMLKYRSGVPTWKDVKFNLIEQ